VRPCGPDPRWCGSRRTPVAPGFFIAGTGTVGHGRENTGPTRQRRHRAEWGSQSVTESVTSIESGVPCASPSWLLAGKAQAVGALKSAPLSLTALPSGCHEAAVRAGTAWDQMGGGGIEFSRNLRLVRGKVASRKELSHQR
jgi:hypothetical protein